jgi:hypothetical protein
VNGDAEKAIKAAARIARKILESRAAELELWRQAREGGASYDAISRGLTLEMAALGMTSEEIKRTGTGPSNVRKRLTRA